MIAVAELIESRSRGRPRLDEPNPGDVRQAIRRREAESLQAIRQEACTRCGGKLWPAYARAEYACFACGAVFYGPDWHEDAEVEL